jgi:hypothetical protein
MNDSLGSACRDACIAIVNHFSHPTNHIDTPHSAEGCNHAESAAAPYFDSILGRPMPALHPPCLCWHEQLLELSVARNNETINAIIFFDVVNSLLRCYESVIHPCVYRKKLAEANDDEIDELVEQPDISLHVVIEIVQNYELLIAHAMKDGCIQLSVDGSTQICSDNNERDDVYMGTASKVIRILADDIFQLSTSSNKVKDETTAWKVRNVLLPCLLRLMEHSVVLLTLRWQQQNIPTNQPSNETIVQHALAIAAVVAVPFVGDGNLNSGAYGIGSLLDWILDRDVDGGNDDSLPLPLPSILSLAYTLQQCSLPPKQSTISQAITSSNFMQRPVVDFSVPSACVSAPWVSSIPFMSNAFRQQRLADFYLA